MSRRSRAGGERTKARRRKTATRKRRNGPKAVGPRTSSIGGPIDASDARRLGQSLRESEERYALVSQAVAEGIYDWNIELNSLFVSSRLMEIFGFDGPGLTSEDWYRRVHPDDMESYRTALRDCFRQRALKIECQYRIKAADGNYRWVEDHGLPIRNKAGRAIRLVGAVSDISRRHQTEQALRDRDQELDAVLDAIDYGIVFMGPDLRAKIINRAFRQMWGISDEFIRMKRPIMSDLINYNRHNNLYDVPADEFDNFVAQRVEAVRSGTTSMSEMRRLDGRIIQYQILALPGGGRMLTYFDITDLKQSEEQAKNARDIAETALAELRSTQDENVRVLNELRQSLQQQTATADALKVISRSTFDLQMVLDVLVRSAANLCDATQAFIFQRHGEHYELAANYGFSRAFEEFARRNPIVPGRGTITGRTVLERKTVHIPDVLADPEYSATEYQARGGYRSNLAVPLLREGVPIGVFVLTRPVVRPFTEKQIELVENFADQAVIAIENTRLLNELRQRTDDLTESLDQQTATSEVLHVISTSSGDLEPVFASMLENAVRISGAKFGIIHGWDGENSRLIATHNLPAAFDEARRRASQWRPGPKTAIRRMAATKKVVHIPNLVEDETYVEDRSPQVVAAVELGGVRTMLAVPMLKDDEVIGAFTVYRQEVRPFTDKQIDLVRNFASQAVIAIENARLLKELRQRTNELAQRQAELSVTFDNMGDGVVMFNEEMRLAAWNKNLQQILDLPDLFFAEPRTYRDYMTYLIEHGEFGDVDLETELRRYIESADRERRVERTRPDGRVLEVRVNPVPGGGFVAIYGDVTERKKAEERVRAARDAAESALRELKSAQDRLVQTEKLASLGQLTAGIAHEIKNPLNFVNNFSAVSVELIDELREALGSVHLDSKQRAEISEIADTLQSNLNKVVQHGKRADSIVKNMLLHSRQGSGEHRPVDINALVEESLNLAYHGARAEKQGFNITLERSFDPTAGEVDLFPQEITRVLLNLISNGFYAATKRKAEANGGDYEPTLAAATKNLGDSVEIRIRDNGTGIPAEVKENLFNPFFTTKPAGEGTGLGLSISHDIIVKQHGGSIEVDTQTGEFTEFRIVLPRRAATVAKSGE